MINKPGHSWGPDMHINLVKTTIGYLACYYDNENSRPEVLRVYNPANPVEEGNMFKDMTLYNYNCLALCPLVRAEIEWIS